jgi:hypothetical protein
MNNISVEIESISTVETGKGAFRCQHAVVKTVAGKEFVYMFEYNDGTWEDMNDYLDNVRTDFERESKFDDFAEDQDGLFIRKELWV